MKFLNLLISLFLTLSLQYAYAGEHATQPQVDMEMTLGTPVILAQQKETVYLKITLLAHSLEQSVQRTPVNIALVLDRSGSMSGQKIKRAKKAAIKVLDYFNNQDILSVISYDDTIDVLVPATKVSHKSRIASRISHLRAGGGTALFAGVSSAADEVRKFLDKNRVNRIILLSDGKANVGPSSPAELGKLGAKLIKEGISVTTLGLGLGYNEDLMAQLAKRSDGNHDFIENATDLARIFKLEFGDLLSVVAQSVEVTIICAPGIRPIRILGREGDIKGQYVTTYLNQLYGNQEKYILLAVEVPASADGTERRLASVEVRYTNMATQRSEYLRAQSTVHFSHSQKHVDDAVDTKTMISAVEQIAVEKNKAAVKLRDAGRLRAAERALKANARYLRKESQKYDSKRLQTQSEENEEAAQNLAPPVWNKQRKQMRKDQYKLESQQDF